MADISISPIATLEDGCATCAALRHRVSELEIEVGHLRAALTTRATIEQAKGVVMAAMGIDPDAAFEILVTQSQHENRKLRDVATEIVERQRRTDPA
jgi:AmiR/NasT family two-component response regulator